MTRQSFCHFLFLNQIFWELSAKSLCVGYGETGKGVVGGLKVY